MKLMGLRFDVVAKDDIYYLLFYDIDGHNFKEYGDDNDGGIAHDVDIIMKTHNISYILYRTKNGYHLVGLTPLTHTQWSSAFGAMKAQFNSYYGGVVIRLSRKKDENQVLVKLEQNYGEVIPNLYNVFCAKFNMQKKPWIKETSKHLLVFEKYRSDKE